MRVKRGRDWSENEPRHIGSGEVGGPIGLTGRESILGEGHSVSGRTRDDDWSGRTGDIAQQANVANQASQGVE